MKNVRLLMLFFIAISISSFSQTQQKKHNSVFLGADFSSNIHLGDIKQYNFYPSSHGYFNEFRFSGTLNAKKMFNNIYGIQGEFGLGKLAGIRREYGQCDYCTDDYSQSIDTLSTKFKTRYTNIDASLLVNLSNLVLNTNRHEKSKIKVFGEFGLGLISFRSAQRRIDNSKVIGVRGYEPVLADNELHKRDVQTEAYYKIATHLIYPLSRRFDMTAKIKYYLVNSDDLDVAHVSGRDVYSSKDDQFLSFSLGLTYALGSKKQSLHWYNPLDEVYHTQSKVRQKMQAMSKDSDDDGVADVFDKHKDTPEGVVVDGSGVPLDVDMDGVYDYQDADLFTAKNAKVDAKGVEKDTDKDGVPDSRDLEKSVKNALVNYQGIAVNTASSERTTILPSIFFNTSSSVIRHDDFKRLALAARVMKDNPKDNYFVVGHADSRGTIDNNKVLAKERAQAAIDYLVEAFGIDANRLEIISKGETNPLVSKKELDASSEYANYPSYDFMNEVNRRVDFIIKK